MTRFISLRWQNFRIWLVPILLLGACAPIPTVEFSSYREAFQAARSTGESVLSRELAAAEKLERTGASKTIKPSNVALKGLPPTLANQAKETKGSIKTDLELRIAAFDTIDNFNKALLSLAEGKSPQKVGTSFSGLVDSVNNLSSIAGVAVPGLGAASPIIKTFLEFAERARSRAEFKRALIEGYPIIQKTIKVLTDDINAYEHTERALAFQELDILEDSTSELGKSAARLARSYAEPVAQSIVARKKAAAGSIKVMIAKFEPTTLPVWINLPGTSSAPAYTELVQSQLDQFVAAAKQNEVKRSKIIKRIEQHQTMLQSYSKLLSGVFEALTKVRSKLDAPQDLTELSTELISLATTVRAQIEVLRDS